MRSSIQVVICCLSLLAASYECRAQTLTVQQPVISQFGVSTTVSVPDRGTALLGGVSGQGFSRYSTGPFRSGSSVGRFSEHRGASVSVYIHDFEELERQLLAGSPTEESRAQQLSELASDPGAIRLRQLLSSTTAIDPKPVQMTQDRTRSGVRKSISRPATSTGSAGKSIVDTTYGKAWMTRRRNLDRTLYRVRSYR